jgi:hypothetical protein
MDPVAPEGGPAGNVRVRCGGGRQVRLWIRWRQPMVVRRHPVAPGQGRSCGFGGQAESKNPHLDYLLVIAFYYLNYGLLIVIFNLY